MLKYDNQLIKKLDFVKKFSFCKNNGTNFNNNLAKKGKNCREFSAITQWNCHFLTQDQDKSVFSSDTFADSPMGLMNLAYLSSHLSCSLFKSNQPSAQL